MLILIGVTKHVLLFLVMIVAAGIRTICFFIGIASLPMTLVSVLGSLGPLVSLLVDRVIFRQAVITPLKV